MAKNKMIVFANQKGGTGKSTLCMMMAHWLADQGKKVVVYDADVQQTFYKQRQDDLAANPGLTPAWEVKPINILNFDLTVKILNEAAEFPGYVLIDAPGTLPFPGLAPILQMADAIAIPFGYDYKQLQSTLTFIEVLLSEEIGKDKKRLFYIPNRIEVNFETADEKRQAAEINFKLNHVGTVTHVIKKAKTLLRVDTINYNRYQLLATQGPFTTITNALKRLK
jgi:chromosome partitioning protein